MGKRRKRRGLPGYKLCKRLMNAGWAYAGPVHTCDDSDGTVHRYTCGHGHTRMDLYTGDTSTELVVGRHVWRGLGSYILMRPQALSDAVQRYLDTWHTRRVHLHDSL